jgi:YidC/Oxa1 family membrane protein insertase
MPVFFAMYGLFNKHFDLRGAPFMLWITDLSAPDSILSFEPIIPFLSSFTDLRILPILFIGTQLLSTKLMQTPDSGASNKNMKMMQTFMPIFFFFILYNAPSGMLLYWIMTNVLTSGQQMVISKIKQRKPSEPSDSDNIIKGKFTKPPRSGRKLPPPKKKPNDNQSRRKDK